VPELVKHSFGGVPAVARRWGVHSRVTIEKNMFVPTANLCEKTTGIGANDIKAKNEEKML
jgi:hypothetical protein